VDAQAIADFVVKHDPQVLYAEYKQTASSKWLRFGQWVMNSYLSQETWPALFYADTPKALKMLETIYYEHRWDNA
jgi:hypothetical protein